MREFINIIESVPAASFTDEDLAQDVSYSPYVRGIMARGPDAMATELERLQGKLARVRAYYAKMGGITDPELYDLLHK